MLKLINIPNIVYDWLANGFPNEDDVEHILEILRGGITIPDNATNGDVLKTMFDIKEVDMSNTYCVHFPEEGEDYGHYFFKDWWNSQYQKGGK